MNLLAPKEANDSEKRGGPSFRKKKYSVFLNAIQEEVADIKQEKAAID